MGIVNRKSLAETVDAVNEACFFGTKLTKPERTEAADWIASRKGKPGSYAGMFAPTDADRAGGIRLFTGERLATHAGVAHVLGEEAGRALLMLDVHTAEVRGALDRAKEGMLVRLKGSEARERGAGRPFLGQYCCGKCSVALWRHLSAGGFEEIHPERWLFAGMNALRLSRDGAGGWRRYPRYYTLLALSGIDLPGAKRERHYAAPTLERMLERMQAEERYGKRRRALAGRVLSAS